MSSPAQTHEHSHHITPVPHLLRTMGLLLALMIATIVAARLPYDVPGFAWMSNMPLLTNGIALGIAIWKAIAVISIFMGVKYSTNITKLYAIGGFFWMMLIFIAAIDYISRPWEPVQGWENAPGTGLPREAGRADGQDPGFKYVPPAGTSKKEAH